MSFAHPLLAVPALIALALLATAYVVAVRRRDARALAYSDLAFALAAMRPSRVPGIALGVAFGAGSAALLFALAGPHFFARVPAKDGSVVICIDTSGSMRAHDVEPSRADAARTAAAAFVAAVPAGTRVGIVAFASTAAVVAPPTADLAAARDALDRLPPPDGGTAIGEALALAAAQMPKTGRRVVVLLTDGVNNLGRDPIDAARAVAATGIRIETVGVGSSGSGQIIPGTGELADLDAQALRTIASIGNGEYVQAANADDLAAAFRHLALGTVWQRRRVDGSFGFAFAGGALVVAAFLAGLASGRFP